MLSENRACLFLYYSSGKFVEGSLHFLQPTVYLFVKHNDTSINATKISPPSCVRTWMDDDDVPIIATYLHREVGSWISCENVCDLGTLETIENEQSLKNVHEQTRHIRVYHTPDG